MPATKVKDAPEGTMSYCEYLEKRRQSVGGKKVVGAPTVFFSHAWSYPFQNVVSAMRAFVEAQPEGSSEVFFWFDTFSIDEHASQSRSQNWWSTTFEEAIDNIGHTVMMLSPWDNPETLTRSWCLFELLATHRSGKTYSICMGTAERDAFHTALCEHPDSVLEAFAGIDVTTARAGTAADQDMILKEAEQYGIAKLNQVAIGELTKWVVSEAGMLLEALGDGPGSSHSLSADDIDKRRKVGILFEKLGTRETLQTAEALFRTVVDESRRLYTDTHKNTLAAQVNLAGVLAAEQKNEEALQIYVTVEREHERQFKKAKKGSKPSAELLATRAARLAVMPETQENKRLQLQVLEDMQKFHHHDHTETLAVQLQVAETHLRLGETKAAIHHFKKVEAGLTPRTLGSLHAQGSLAELQGDDARRQEALHGITSMHDNEHAKAVRQRWRDAAAKAREVAGA
eukprot:COSAG06_NODE_7080_length_2641_cov_9.481904_2_plen_456_part_00